MGLSWLLPPPCSPSSLAQQGSNKETTISSRRRSGRMEGPIPWISSSSHTFWCQTHFISSRLGTQGLPLQDYFLLQLVFQLETLGAPQQGAAGWGAAPLLWPMRLQRAQSGMPAGETAGLGGGAQGVRLWMESPTHFQVPLRSYMYG